MPSRSTAPGSTAADDFAQRSARAADKTRVERRELAALLFFLDRLPPSSARWKAEEIVLQALLAADDEGRERSPPASSGVFRIT